MFEATPKRLRQWPLWVLTAGFLGLFGWGVFLLFAPDHFPLNFARGTVVRMAPDLLFGPYPVEEELRRLKRMGVVEVVSLLDTGSAVEAELVDRERPRVEALGMRFVSLPVPLAALAGGGDDAVARAAAYLRVHRASLSYVHCYLGRHRVALLEAALGLAPPTAEPS